MIKLKAYPEIWASHYHLASLDNQGLCNAGVFRYARDNDRGTNIFIGESQNGYGGGHWNKNVSFEEGVRVLEVFLGARIERD